MKKQIPPLQNHGGFFTYADEGQTRCLGYLLCAPGHGTFEPTFGRVEISPEQAQVHNQLLSQAEIDGLDHHCGIGQGGMFYIGQEAGRRIITTWIGAAVSRDVQVRGQVLTFRRNSMIFRGRLGRDSDCFRFKRVA